MDAAFDEGRHCEAERGNGHHETDAEACVQDTAYEAGNQIAELLHLIDDGHALPQGPCAITFEHLRERRLYGRRLQSVQNGQGDLHARNDGDAEAYPGDPDQRENGDDTG